MRQLLVSIVLLAGFVAVCCVQEAPVAAQGKKDAKDAKASPYIDVTEGKDGKFRFVVRNGEGKLLAMSGPSGYATEKDALKAIEDLKEGVGKAKINPTKKSKAEKAKAEKK
jgi:uncharacterized protein YegP (UPF0339 family)